MTIWRCKLYDYRKSNPICHVYSITGGVVWVKRLGKLRLRGRDDVEGCWNRLKLGSNPSNPILRVQKARLGLVELGRLLYPYYF